MTANKQHGRTLLRLALVAAALVCPVQRSARAQGKSPRVVYVVNAGALTEQIVLRIQECCNDDARAIKWQGARVCPPEPHLPCEFLRIIRTSTGYRVENDFPADERHIKMMTADIEFESQNPKAQEDQFWYDLKKMITCHDFKWHEDSLHTIRGTDCDRCAKQSKAPPARRTDK